MENLSCLTCKMKSNATRKLTVEELEILENGHAGVSFKPGEIIVKQNALSTNVVYIQSGLVKIHIKGPVKERIMKVVKAPAYICLPGNFSQKVNHISATALEETSVCFIDLDVFKRFITTNGDFAYQVLLEMSKNEIRNFQNCLNNAQKQTAGRIADCILFFSKEIYNNSTYVLPVSRQELGDMVGTTRESASRTLTEFNHEKIISLEGKRITILNEKLLQQISEKG